MSSKTPLPTGQKASPEAHLDALLQDIVAGEREMNETRFAPLRHSHPEFKRLEQAVADYFLAMRPVDVSQFALKDHTHPENIKSLSMIERGKELEKLLESDFCPRFHQHPHLDAGLDQLKAEMAEMKKAILDLKGEIADLQMSLAISNTAIKKQAAELKKAQESIPEIIREEPEIMGSRFCLVPQRCDGRAIKSIYACDYEGSPISSPAIRCGSNLISVGSVCKHGDLLSLPPNCIVLFRFQ